MEEQSRHSLYKKNKARFTKRLRKRMTNAEQLLWEQLRNRRFHNIKFRRQVNVGPYIADFLCVQHRVIIEVDGSSHNDKKEYDQDRDEYLEELHYRVIRITNQDVENDIDRVLQQIYLFIFPQRSSPSS